jgi:hypothetical protein
MDTAASIVKAVTANDIRQTYGAIRFADAVRDGATFFAGQTAYDQLRHALEEKGVALKLSSILDPDVILAINTKSIDGRLIALVSEVLSGELS